MAQTPRASKQPETKVSTSAQSPIPFALHVPFAAALLIAIAGALAAGQFTWGFDFWSLVPVWLLGLAILSYVAASIPSVSAQLYRTGETFAQQIGSIPSPVRIIVLAGAALTLFIVFRSGTALYGDGSLVVTLSSLPGTEKLVDIHSRFRPLTSILYRLGNFLFADTLHFTDQTAYGIVSAVGGVVGLFGLARLAGALTSSRPAKAFLFFCALGSGCTVLFFGYIEVYVWSTAVLVWHLYFSVRHANGDASWTQVAASGMIMCLFNAILAPVLIATLGLLITRRDAADGQVSYLFGWSFARIMIAVGALSIVVAAIPRGFLPGAFSVFLRPLPDASYWAFAPHHLLDVLNLMLLVVPLLPGLLIVLILLRKSGQAPVEPSLHIILAAAIVAFLFAFWMDPVLGAPRDWDLLSSFGFPASIAAGYVIIKRLPNATAARLLVAPTAVVMVILLVPNLYEKTDAIRSAERLDRLLWQDPHYQADYVSAWNCVHWSFQLHAGLQRDDLARKYIERRVAADTTDDRSWFMLGEAQMGANRADSAEMAFRRATALKPTDESYRMGLVWALQAQGKSDEAAQLMPAQPTGQEDAYAQRSLGVTLAEQGRVAEALEAFRRADRMNPESLPEKINLGLVFIQLRQPDSAIHYLSAALRLSDKSSRCPVHEALVEQYLAAGRTQEALSAFAEFEKTCPHESAIAAVRQEINPLRGQ